MSQMGAKRLTHVRRLRMHSGLAMQSRPSLWIRTAASPSIGFGHLRRALALAEILEEAVEPHFLVDSHDRWSRCEAIARGWGHSNFGSTGLWTGVLTPSAILVDTRVKRGLTALISGAQERRIPVASIHDLGLNPLPSNVVIDGSLSPGIKHSRGA